jgi:mannosyltransferase OCH1-like enzyme
VEAGDLSGAEFDATVQTPQADPQPHSQRIPKQLHRIWVGPNPLPNAAVVLWEGFRALHPDWELTTWTEPINPAAYELGRLFRSCQHPAQLADLLRIELLWQHGGVYVDVDCEAIRPFDPLLEHLLFIGANQGELQNAVIGSIPGHPGLRDVMDTLLEHKVLPPISVNEATGPILLTRVLGARPDITILPKESFFPWTWSEVPDRSLITDRTYVVQHWTLSWSKPSTRRRRIYGWVFTKWPIIGRLRASLRRPVLAKR